jgi:hypothetical protein
MQRQVPPRPTVPWRALPPWLQGLPASSRIHAHLDDRRSLAAVRPGRPPSSGHCSLHWQGCGSESRQTQGCGREGRQTQGRSPAEASLFVFPICDNCSLNLLIMSYEILEAKQIWSHSSNSLNQTKHRITLIWIIHSTKTWMVHPIPNKPVTRHALNAEAGADRCYRHACTVWLRTLHAEADPSAVSLLICYASAQASLRGIMDGTKIV